jgi:hypothetical protein
MEGKSLPKRDWAISFLSVTYAKSDDFFFEFCVASDWAISFLRFVHAKIEAFRL